VSTRVTVLAPYAVFDGSTQRGPGETFEASDEEVGRWLAEGWVTPAAPTRRRRAEPPDAGGS
jgi:hypothetical protein